MWKQLWGLVLVLVGVLVSLVGGANAVLMKFFGGTFGEFSSWFVIGILLTVAGLFLLLKKKNKVKKR